MKLNRKPRPALSLASEPGAPAMTLGRAHEATGPAAVVFAALIAGRLRGPVLWVRPSWAEGRLNPNGLAAFFDPARLVVAHADRAPDILWTAEEALRSGAAPLVIAEPAEPPALTPLRRLQLAAEAGGAAARELTGGGGGGPTAPRQSAEASESSKEFMVLDDENLANAPPLCLLLSQKAGAAGAVESRWRCAPLPAWAGRGEASSPGWRFERTYSKSGPPLIWEAGAEEIRRRAA